MTATRTGTVTAPYSPDLRAIGIDGTAYKVMDYVEPYAKKVQKGDTVTFKQDVAGTLLRIAPAEQNSTYPAPAPEQPAPKKAPAPEDLPWNRPTGSSAVREQAQETAARNVKQAMSAEKAADLAAIIKATKGPEPPLRPPMTPTDLREHRIYWNGLLNTANATIAMRNPEDVPVAVLSDTVIETARKYDRFIRTQAMATLQEGKA